VCPAGGQVHGDELGIRDDQVRGHLEVGEGLQENLDPLLERFVGDQLIECGEIVPVQDLFELTLHDHALTLRGAGARSMRPR
jgi:hypothetical protein